MQAKLERPFEAARMKAALVQSLGPGHRITTWEEENGDFFQALRLEKPAGSQNQ